MPKYAEEILAAVTELQQHPTAEQVFLEMKKGRGALSGVQCTAGIRQRAAGQMPAWENLAAL